MCSSLPEMCIRDRSEYAKYAEASAKLSELPIVFNRRTGMDMRGVTALAYNERPGLIVLDHIGLLEQENKKATLYESCLLYTSRCV